ncbi:MAG: hypothetical protein RMJ87_03515 [Cytophagales bacterium]|nr:hypothetical protein [Bernardetiaceae bacterium]MDW8204076.1 hypothetical protein [Cytophagales bacterium]
METIYQSRVWTIYWHENAKCLRPVFNDYTKQMTYEEYLQELDKYEELIHHFKPQSICADMRSFYFTISPDIQQRINERILAFYNQIQLKKHALLVSPDFIAQLSIEQTMDENNNTSYENRYFGSERDAIAWLGLTI